MIFLWVFLCPRYCSGLPKLPIPHRHHSPSLSSLFCFLLPSSLLLHASPRLFFYFLSLLFFLCGCIECVCTFCVWGQMRVYLHKSSFTLFISFLYMWVNSCVCACMCSWKQAHVYHSASLEIRGQPQVLLVTFHIVWVMVSFFCVLFITVLPD